MTQAAQPISPIAAFFRRDRSAAAQPETLPAVVAAVLARPVESFRPAHRPEGAPAATTGPLTHVAFVLDASGSMERDKAETISGFNAQVGTVREGAVTAGRTTFTDVQFGGEVRMNAVATDIDAMHPLTAATYRPDGNTPLYDALGDTVAALLATPRIDEANTATLVTVFTDGLENASTRYDAATLSGLIERLEATGRWTFALVGPRGSVHQLADALAVRHDNVGAYDPLSVAEKVEAFGTTQVASAAYMAARSAGATSRRGLFGKR